MALENPTWGQERIANELLLKLGLKVSPRTARKDMPDHCVGGPGKRHQSQRWSTFVRNHAKGIISCDFCVAVTATFRVLYVFVIIEHTSRRLIHVVVYPQPTDNSSRSRCGKMSLFHPREGGLHHDIQPVVLPTPTGRSRVGLPHHPCLVARSSQGAAAEVPSTR
jgi:hypothetical protein